MIWELWFILLGFLAWFSYLFGVEVYNSYKTKAFLFFFVKYDTSRDLYDRFEKFRPSPTYQDFFKQWSSNYRKSIGQEDEVDYEFWQTRSTGAVTVPPTFTHLTVSTIRNVIQNAPHLFSSLSTDLENVFTSKERRHQCVFYTHENFSMDTRKGRIIFLDLTVWPKKLEELKTFFKKKVPIYKDGSGNISDKPGTGGEYWGHLLYELKYDSILINDSSLI